MTARERAKAIKEHLAAYDARIVKRRKARVSTDNRKKLRGLRAAVERMKS